MENINTTSKKLNTYKNSEENTIYSNTDIENLNIFNINFPNKNSINITLLNYNDYIIASGKDIEEYYRATNASL